MTGSLNRVELIGHLGRDPEIRSNQDGSKRALLSIATSKRWTDKVTGERRQATEWHRVVLWDPQKATIAQKYLRKGSPVYLEGELRSRKWMDGDGKERWTAEITLTQFNGYLVLLGQHGEGEAAESSVVPPPAELEPPDHEDTIPF